MEDSLGAMMLRKIHAEDAIGKAYKPVEGFVLPGELSQSLSIQELQPSPSSHCTFSMETQWPVVRPPSPNLTWNQSNSKRCFAAIIGMGEETLTMPMQRLSHSLK